MPVNSLWSMARTPSSMWRLRPQVGAPPALRAWRRVDVALQKFSGALVWRSVAHCAVPSVFFPLSIPCQTNSRFCRFHSRLAETAMSANRCSHAPVLYDNTLTWSSPHHSIFKIPVREVTSRPCRMSGFVGFRYAMMRECRPMPSRKTLLGRPSRTTCRLPRRRSMPSAMSRSSMARSRRDGMLPRLPPRSAHRNKCSRRRVGLVLLLAEEFGKGSCRWRSGRKGSELLAWTAVQNERGRHRRRPQIAFHS